MPEALKAALIRFDWDLGPVNWDIFDGPGCVIHAQDFRDMVKDDFPGSVFTVVATDAATKDHADKIFDRGIYEKGDQ